jgi:hypothetical protein
MTESDFGPHVFQIFLTLQWQNLKTILRKILVGLLLTAH